MSASNLYPSGTNVEPLGNSAVVANFSHVGFGSISNASIITQLDVGKGFITASFQFPNATCSITGGSTFNLTMVNNPLFAIHPSFAIGHMVGYCRFRNTTAGTTQFVPLTLTATAGGIQFTCDSITLTALQIHTMTAFIQYPRP